MSGPLVTKDSIQSMLDNPNQEYVMHVIGRGLTAIFNGQTKDEQSSNVAKINNKIGFSGVDAKSGSLTAKYYIKHKRLENWMVEAWIKRSAKSHYSRLTKYHAQLNQAAQDKSK